MERTTIAAMFADQEQLGGQTVTVMGWARTIRVVRGRRCWMVRRNSTLCRFFCRG